MRGAFVACLLAGCSFSTVREPTTPGAAQRCHHAAPLADTMLGAGLLGAAIGAGTLAVRGERGDAPPMLTIAGALAMAGGVFMVSARYGSRVHDACRREEVLASMPVAEPLHVPGPIAATCEQRRLDMYSRAVTGADPEQRLRLLATLPTCDGPAARERAWTLTRSASLAASAGKCDDVEPIAREVLSLDVVLHDVVLLADVEIKHCLSLREL
jgi:hypothetical protein